MSIVPVQVKHSGKKYEVQLDTSEPGLVFKMQLYSLTGVPPDRQKILAKGGQLKDDSDMSTLNIKPNHSFMMLGSAGELPKAPEKVATFVEDMTDRQIAQASAIPTGLNNLGNTCYMNSTLQALKTIPELQERLKDYRSTTSSSLGARDLTAELSSLYKGMGQTTSAFYPLSFLNALRTTYPQFAEQGNDGHYKQQDAEEAWSQIVSNLRLNLKDPNGNSFVDDYMTGEFVNELKSVELPDEPSKITEEKFLKLDCHISVNTNFLRDGLLAGLEDKIEKHSDTLDRNAEFINTKRISRLPEYLTIHYVRFFWRRDTQKKSKILRKVSFPFELDVTEFCTDDLKQKLIPVREKLQEIRKEKDELERAAKKARFQQVDDEAAGNNGSSATETLKPRVISNEKLEEYKVEIDKLTDPVLKADVGANTTGLYQLSAIVTHQGASADSGHYQCFTRDTKEEGKWWRFNDDKGKF